MASTGARLDLLGVSTHVAAHLVDMGAGIWSYARYIKNCGRSPSTQDHQHGSSIWVAAVNIGSLAFIKTFLGICLTELVYARLAEDTPIRLFGTVYFLSEFATKLTHWYHERYLRGSANLDRAMRAMDTFGYNLAATMQVTNVALPLTLSLQLTSDLSLTPNGSENLDLWLMTALRCATCMGLSVGAAKLLTSLKERGVLGGRRSRLFEISNALVPPILYVAPLVLSFGFYTERQTWFYQALHALALTAPNIPWPLKEVCFFSTLLLRYRVGLGPGLTEVMTPLLTALATVNAANAANTTEASRHALLNISNVLGLEHPNGLIPGGNGTSPLLMNPAGQQQLVWNPSFGSPTFQNMTMAQAVHQLKHAMPPEAATWTDYFVGKLVETGVSAADLLVSSD